MTTTATGIALRFGDFPLRPKRLSGVLANGDLEYVKYLFARNDPKLRKEALQYLAIRLERGATLTPRQRAEVLRLTREAIGSLDWPITSSLRLWTYILACHTREPQAASALWRAALTEEEEHVAMWACAAVCLSTPPLALFLDEPSGSTYQDLVLVGQYAAARGMEIDAAFTLAIGTLAMGRYLVDTAQAAIDQAETSPNYMEWLLLGLGRDEIVFATPKEKRRILSFVQGDCLGHDSTRIAEYSLWALYRHDRDRILPAEARSRVRRWADENVRRWGYRAFAKDPASKIANLDFLVEQVRQEDTNATARLGVALALVNKPGHDYDQFDFNLPRECRHLIIDWHGRETLESISSRLTDYLVCMSEKDSLIRDYLFELIDGDLDRDVISIIKRRRSRAPSLAAHLDQSRLRGQLLLSATNNSGGAVDSGDDLSARNRHLTAAVQRSHAFGQEARVLIVTALPIEGTGVAATFDEVGHPEGRPNDPNIYRIGTYIIKSGAGGQRRVRLVTQHAMGKAKAAVVTTHALRSYPEIEHVLMVGIAGGCPNPHKPDQHVRLGDVVVSNDRGIVDYSYVKATETRVEHRSPPREPSPRLLQAHNLLTQGAMIGAMPWEQHLEVALKKLLPGEGFARPAELMDVLKASNGDEIPHPFDRLRRAGQPRVHGGAIGTADVLVKNYKLRDYIRDKFEARAIEMESSGVENAAFASEKGIIVIRGICDYADKWKNDIWQRYAALAAASYARALIEVLPAEWFP